MDAVSTESKNRYALLNIRSFIPGGFCCTYVSVSSRFDEPAGTDKADRYINHQSSAFQYPIL
jgi:hypothetical protein